MSSTAQKERWRPCSLWLDARSSGKAPSHRSVTVRLPREIPQETTQERRHLTRKATEELAAVCGMLPTALDEVPDKIANGLDTLARPLSAWDPFEVWRTRVRGSSDAGAVCAT
jgi:hypothetical protein